MTAANCNEPKPRKVITLPPGAKLSYTVAEGAAALGVSSSTLWAMIKDGELVAKRLRGRTLLTREEMWQLLGGFFPTEMERQTLVPHAREALIDIARAADIVVLTNLPEPCRDARIAQLATHGIAHRVVCNQGGKGAPVARLVAEYGATVTVFVDDLATHHESVARHAPQVHRLHMISEPSLAPTVPKAPHAHARIDDWRDAAMWIETRFAEGAPAPETTGEIA